MSTQGKDHPIACASSPFLAAGQLRKVDGNSAMDPDKVEETVLINSNTDRLLRSSSLPKGYPSIEGIVIFQFLSTGLSFLPENYERRSLSYYD